MKKSILPVFLVVLTIHAFSQSRKISQATVERTLNVPIYLYSYPTQEYEEVGILSATWSVMAAALGESIGISERTRELIYKAKKKKAKGKIPEFNAMIINPDDYTATLIVLSDKSSLTAEVSRVHGVPVYIYSYPTKEYEEVGTLSATWSALSPDSSLREIVVELVRIAKRKEKKGKIEQFDAIIISPDDFTGIVIKFNE